MTKPIIVVKICYKLFKYLKRFLISNFLASKEYQSFWSHLFAMLILIGLALFLHPRGGSRGVFGVSRPPSRNISKKPKSDVLV